MNTDQSLWNYFADASVIVKIVMLLLLAASVMSWMLIFQRGIILKKARAAITQFEDLFWSGTDLGKLYLDLSAKSQEPQGMESIFQSGFREFVRMRKQASVTPGVVLEATQRAMRIARSREMDRLEQHLPFLATVGSTSPYIGLFGTVWGIMTSFHALSASSQATIAMVAPGISEALVATAMGLFAAIPAVIAYNRYASEVDRLMNQYETFQEEFFSVLDRQAHNSGGQPV